MLRQIKTYTEETSVHGIRYLGSKGNGFVQRLVWGVTILASFTVAGIMIAANVRDTNERPIATAVRSIPVQEVDFPAVSLWRNYLFTPERFLESVLNRIEFDCASAPWESRGQCQSDTQETRDDLMPAVRRALTVAFGAVNEYLRKVTANWGGGCSSSEAALIARHDLARYLCSDATSSGYQRAVAYGLAMAYENTSDASERAHRMLDAIAEDFRYSIFALDTLWEAAAEFYEPLWTFWFMGEQECYDAFVNHSLVSNATLRFTATTIKVLGREDENIRLPLGSLLTLDEELGLERDFKHVQNASQRDALNSIVDLYQDLKGNDASFTAFSLMNFVRTRRWSRPSRDVRLHHSSEPFIAHILKHGHTKVNTSYCVGNECEACCQIEKEISGNLEAMYKILKYIVVPPSRLILEQSEARDIERFSGELGYTLHQEPLKNLHPLIVACQFSDNMEITEECDLFSRAFTNRGIGYTFNQPPFWEMYQNTTGNAAFFTEMVARSDYSASERPVVKIQSNGRSHSLKFMVKHYDRHEDDCDVFIKHFFESRMKLHDPNSFPDLQNSDFELQPGMFYDISVIPSVTVTDESALRLDVPKRECLTSSESHKLKLFKTYSQYACMFECKLQKAIDACNCSLWDLPLPEGVRVCPELFGNFEKLLHQPASAMECDCPNACAETRYDLIPSIRPLTSDDLCHHYDKAATTNFMDTFLYKLTRQENLFFDEDTFRRSAPDLGLCRELLGEISIVQISAVPVMVTQTVRSARVSFSGQLANLGGIIGLFSGMSILSLVEFGYWMARSIGSALKPSKGKTMKHTKTSPRQNILYY